jgi:hypothetical protein
MMNRARKFAMALALLMGCGENETLLILDVDVSAFEVPAEINSVYLELQDTGTPLLGRTFDVTEESPIVELRPGGRFKESFDVVAYGFLDTVLVSQSDVKSVSFTKDDSKIVNIKIPSP